MSVSFELVLDGFGFDNPLVRPFPALMDELSGLVAVHGVNLTLRVRHVWALDLEALDEHFPEKEKWLRERGKF